MNGNKKIVKASSYFLYIFGMTCFFVLMDLDISWDKIYPLILRHILPVIIMAIIGVELSEYWVKKGLEISNGQSQENQ
ncbi:MAG: hypothetical protein AAFZ15_22925 [Bacteroidota bacterium]